MSPAISPVAPSPTLPLSSRRPSVSFGGFGLTSPRRFGGRGPDSHVRRQLNGPKDCHTLYPGTGAGVPLRWAGSLDHNGVGCRLQLLGTMGVGCCDHNALWPPSPSTRRLRLLPTFRRPVGLLPIGPPPTGLAAWFRLLPAIPQSTLPNSSHPCTRTAHIQLRTPVPSTVARYDGWCCRPEIRSAIGSIGTRYAGER